MSVVGAGISSNWSVTSFDSNDLDGGVRDEGEMTRKTTISPRMRDQMKYYMSRHMGVQKGKK